MAILIVLAAILIPFLLFERQVTQWSLSLVRTGRDNPALLGTILAALLAADVVLPIPSSVLSVLGGAIFGLAAGAVTIWCGMTAGCLIGYVLGRGAGRTVMRGIVSEGDLDRARVFMSGAGGAALLVTRGIPVLAESAVLGAGITRYPFSRFMVLTSFANLAVALAYAAIGAFAMERASFFILFAGLLALPALGWVAWTRIIK